MVKNNEAKVKRVKVRQLDDKTDFLERHSKTIGLLEDQIEMLRKREFELNELTTALEERNLRLEELNQIKDEFIGIASHQLRTPATGVKQYINLLLDGYADEVTSSQRVFLERAHESNDRQLRIIDDLLQVARIDSETFKLHKGTIDAGKLVTKIADDFKDRLKIRDMQLKFKNPVKPIIVTADAERLRMVIENLLDNAINYSPEGKEVILKIDKKKANVIISIQDQGVGIDERDYSKLFQKFSRIPNSLSVEVGGTGLGLYWADKVARLHGGRIDVNSKLDKGSIFSVVLPV